MYTTLKTKNKTLSQESDARSVPVFRSLNSTPNSNSSDINLNISSLTDEENFIRENHLKSHSANISNDGLNVLCSSFNELTIRDRQVNPATTSLSSISGQTLKGFSQPSPLHVNSKEHFVMQSTHLNTSMPVFQVFTSGCRGEIPADISHSKSEIEIEPHSLKRRRLTNYCYLLGIAPMKW